MKTNYPIRAVHDLRMLSAKRKLEEESERKLVENKFETLCGTITSQEIIWNHCLANVLDLKNEILKHPIPPSLMLKLTVCHSELFRSQADLMAPVRELVRLVTVYKHSLEEKSIALKRIDGENERRKVELDIAVKKLEQSYNYEKQWRRDHTLNNWERIFCKAALNRTHGRRWKFVISKVKQRAALGLSVFNPLLDSVSDDEGMAAHAGIVAPRFTYGSTTNSSIGMTKRSGITSHYTTSVNSTAKQSSAVQSSLLSSSLKLDTSGDTEDEDTQDTEPLPTKQIRSPTAYKSPAVAPAKKKVQTKDTAVSTEDIEHDKILRIQVFNPIGFKLAHTDISCKFSLLGQTKESNILDYSDEGNFDEVGFLFEGEEYKSLGYKRGTSLGALLEEEVSEQLEITIHHGDDRKIFALSTIPIEDISDSQPEVRDTINQDDVVPKPFPIFALEGDVTAPCGYLPIFCVWQLKVRKKRIDIGVCTEGDDMPMELCEEDVEELEDVMSHAKVSSASPALSKKSVSVMIPTPKPPSEPATPEPNVLDPDSDRIISPHSKKETDQVVEDIVRANAHDMAVAHAQEIERLQYEYELRLEGMAKALEMMKIEQEEARAAAEYSRTPMSLVSCFSNTPRPSSSSEVVQKSGRVEVPSVPVQQRSVTTLNEGKRKRQNFRKREVLPRDFFERMEYFTRTSLSRQQDLVIRVRDEVRSHAESAMATQHRLSQRVTSADSADSGINEATQDLSLPAIFMPKKTGLVFSPKAYRYFHPPGSKEPRLSQAPSVFQLPHMSKTPVLNLFDLSQKNVVRNGPGWLYKTCKDVTKR
ncbi:hypothetical protein ACHWQZ_G018046 [Mnemiopsis leidyi]